MFLTVSREIYGAARLDGAGPTRLRVEILLSLV